MSFCDPEMRTPDCGKPDCRPCRRWRRACDGKGQVWICGSCHPATVEPDGVHPHPCDGCLACRPEEKRIACDRTLPPHGETCYGYLEVKGEWMDAESCDRKQLQQCEKCKNVEVV